jgi:hypothetical protein
VAPDNQVSNRPYRVFFASGEWTCSISRLTGTMTGPLVLADGTEIPPTGKPFSVDFCTVAHWVDGLIVEENLFYDLVGFMNQVGICKTTDQPLRSDRTTRRPAARRERSEPLVPRRSARQHVYPRRPDPARNTRTTKRNPSSHEA